jgi:Zn-dependent protease with chaperone function
MNFFEHQARARRQTRWLIAVFIIAMLLFVLSIDLVLMAAMGEFNASGGDFSLSEHAASLGITSVVVIGFILLASLFRTLSLRSGGAAVAAELGGVRVDADTNDPLRRRLRNVVEEIALASGVPVPDVYVLERESGINAFAAGYTTADAAVAVTRGTLEKLNREQLQGVIAHEFSHILNGDMRLNIRMIGILFGILVVSVIGRKMLYAGRYSHRSYSRDNNRAGIMVVALAITMIGYLGLFMARWIKASVARRREFLADASAVQFTRNPQGIAGALKRIAVDSQGSLLDVDTEEVNHMMFGEGSVARLFASHPPIMERVQRIEPDFTAEALAVFGRQIERRNRRAIAEEERARAETGSGGAIFNPAEWIEHIGNPGQEQLAYAGMVAASLNESIQAAAHSVEWAPEVVLGLLLEKNQSLREEQLLIITRRLGADSEQQLRYIVQDMADLEQAQKLPLIEMTFPALKRRPIEDLRRLQSLIEEIILVDGHVDVFEYTVARLLQVMVDDLVDPPGAAYGNNKTIKGLKSEVAALIGVLARHGYVDFSQAKPAIQAGMKKVGLSDTAIPDYPDDWKAVLDMVLKPLDRLKLKEKEKLVGALIETAIHDRQLLAEEAELLRAICACLHVPLPMIELEAESGKGQVLPAQS